MTAILAICFFLAAALYAAAGFGGGSAYQALMVLAGVDYVLLPAIALLCNLIVVSGSCYNFLRANLIRWRFALPFVVFSVPFAWLGGRLPIEKSAFLLVLGTALLAAGALMLVPRDDSSLQDQTNVSPAHWWVGAPIGLGLGLLAGVTGNGGGIFLAPILHILRLASTKVIAATCSFFILVNSLAALAGQLSKLATFGRVMDLTGYVWLFLAVFIGGQLGNQLNLTALSPQMVRRLTALIVLLAGGRLFYSWYGG